MIDISGIEITLPNLKKIGFHTLEDSDFARLEVTWFCEIVYYKGQFNLDTLDSEDSNIELTFDNTIEIENFVKHFKND